MANPIIGFDVAPWRLSGVVYGTLMNDRTALTALGDQVDRDPYKAPPKAPVLYVKPRNTLAASGASVSVPFDAGEFVIGATLGLVIGRTTCRVSPSQAISCLAGYTMVVDLSVPHESFYRPSIRFKARDGSCLIGPSVVARDDIREPDCLTLRVLLDGKRVQTARTSNMLRPVAELIASVSDFMTLSPGDVLMLGVTAGAPRARTGQNFAVEADVLGRLEGRLVAEPEVVSA